MGTIKIDLDLPEFKDELQINIVIKKDGEVICNANDLGTNNSEVNALQPSSLSKIADEESKKSKKKETSGVKEEKPAKKKAVGGNFMNNSDLFLN